MTSLHHAFSERVGTEFAVDVAPEGTVVLTLADCSPLQRAGGYSSFTLTLRGAATQPLAQGTFAFTANGFDPVDIFIVPTGTTAEDIDYEAVFNQKED